MAFNSPLVDDEIPSSAKWNTAVCVYDRATAEVDVTNTVTETVIYTKAIGAGHASTDREIRTTIRGDYLNNSGGADGPTVRVKLGGSTILSFATSSGASASRFGFRLEVTVSMLGAATAEWVEATLWEANPASGAVGNGRPQVAAAAIDMAVAQTLEITVQWATASTSRSYRKEMAVMELVG